MHETELFDKLKAAYNTETLNRISTHLISAYKNKKYRFLRNLAEKLKWQVEFRHKKINRIFSRLMMLYHPDRTEYYQSRIKDYFQNSDKMRLYSLSHIFHVIEIIDKEQQDSMQSLSVTTDDERNVSDIDVNELEQRDFFSAIKHLEYGNVDVPLEYHHLEEIDGDLDVSSYNIDDLTGVEYCRNITSLDLSCNNISDLSKLADLTDLEELFLSQNCISDLSPIGHLKHLACLDISDNLVTDISVLNELPDLEYVNLSGNSIPREQYNILQDRGVLIVF